VRYASSYPIGSGSFDKSRRADNRMDVDFMGSLITGGDPPVNAVVSVEHTPCARVLADDYWARNIDAAGVRVTTHKLSQFLHGPLPSGL
jgi:hypothetical protein